MGQALSNSTHDRVELVLASTSGGQDELRLLFSVHETRVAQQWASELRLVEQQQLPVKYPEERFYNFSRTKRTKENVSADIWRCIEQINEYAPGTIPVERRASDEIDQGLLNNMHGYFERLRGSIEAPAPFFAAAPSRVREALQDYNLHIHRLEDMERMEHRIQAGNRPSPRLTVAFDHRRRRVKLQAPDFTHFTLRMEFGSAYLNYCGK